MVIKVLRDYCIFILAVMSFLTSCQMTNTGEKNTSVLDENPRIEDKEQTDETAKSEIDITEKLDEKFVQTEIEPIVEQETSEKESYENISSAQKIKDQKRILDFFSDFFKSDEAEEKMPEKENIKKSELLKKQTIISNDKNIDKIYGKEKGTRMQS